jgi:tetratricopeptide (TPR) repeat protein
LAEQGDPGRIDGEAGGVENPAEIHGELYAEDDDDLASLERAAHGLRRAVEAAAKSGDRGTYLISLCEVLRRLDEEYQVPGSGEEAIEVGRAAVAATGGSPEHSAAANNLALALWARYDSTGEGALLRQAADILRDALEAASPDDEHRVRYQANLGLALRDLHLAFGQDDVLRTAVTELRRALDMAGPEHPDAPAIAGNLGLALQDLAEQTGERAELREAIDLLRAVVDAGDPGDPDHGRNLSNLSTALQDWYEMASDAAALEESVRLARAAVEITPADHPHLPARLSHLGLALRMSYESSGVPAMLREAVDVSRRAVEEADPDYPRLHVYLSNLGSALRFHYEHTGSVPALEEAIEVTRRAVEAAPGDNYQRAAYQSNLALALWTRYERGGGLDTLREAVGTARAAVARTDPGSPDHCRYGTNLGLALWTLHDREPESGALDEAVRILSEVLDATRPDHAEYARFASNLSNAFRARYLHGRRPADLDGALTAGRAAVAHTRARPGHVDHAKHLSNVGALLVDRYRHTKQVRDLEEAVPLFREAVTITPADHLDHALYSFNLGEALQLQAQGGLAAGAGAAVEEALTHLEAAAAAPQAPPSLRVEAAWTAGGLCAAGQDWSHGLELLAAAVGLLPRVAPRHLALRDRGHGLSGFLGLVSDAAAAALHCGDADRALLLLEEGRGLLLGRALERDEDFARLRRRAPELAERFEGLRERLDAHVPAAPERPGPPWEGDPETAGAADPPSRAAGPRDGGHAAAAEWEELLEEIRGLPDLRRFLRQPPLRDLLAAVPDGVVVVVNCSRYRCDALLVDRRAVRPVALPGLSMPELTARVRALRGALTEVTETEGRARRAAERRFTAMFSELSRWLWTAVAGPVVRALGPAAGPHRVWWSPTGPLTALPLHAAGRDAPGDLLDLAVSSYTPTVRALRAAAATAPPFPRREGDTVAVPGDRVVLVDAAPDLEAAGGEVREVAGLLGTPAPLSGPDATREDVRRALAGCTVAHLAVHAVGDPVNPGRSHLALADGPLTLLDVTGLRPDRPWLAYLSACDTAEPGDELADEALHLAAAFQAAGFPHVVATLWPAEDETAAELAAAFYSRGVPADPARALRRALRALRDAHPGRPLHWAPYLHLGA